jgi:hypothetical protein
MNQVIEQKTITFLFKKACSGESIHTRLKTVYGAAWYAKGERTDISIIPQACLDDSEKESTNGKC